MSIYGNLVPGPDRNVSTGLGRGPEDMQNALSRRMVLPPQPISKTFLEIGDPENVLAEINNHDAEWGERRAKMLQKYHLNVFTYNVLRSWPLFQYLSDDDSEPPAAGECSISLVRKWGGESYRCTLSFPDDQTHTVNSLDIMTLPYAIMFTIHKRRQETNKEYRIRQVRLVVFGEHGLGTLGSISSPLGTAGPIPYLGSLSEMDLDLFRWMHSNLSRLHRVAEPLFTGVEVFLHEQPGILAPDDVMSRGRGFDLFIHVMNHNSPGSVIAMRFNNYPWQTILGEMDALIDEFGFREEHLISTCKVTYFLGNKSKSYGDMIIHTVKDHVCNFGIPDE